MLDGDWFGGLHAGNAEEFLDALLNTKASSPPVGCCIKLLAAASLCRLHIVHGDTADAVFFALLQITAGV